MNRQEEIDAIEKQIANLNFLVGGPGIKKILLEQVQALRSSVTTDVGAAASITKSIAIENDEVSSVSESQLHLILQKVDGIQNEIVQLRETLNLKETPSIDYVRIKENKVRRQLVADNIRMEQARFHEEQAFRRYCTFAFFQVEQLLTYYFHHKFNSIEDLKKDFKSLEIKEDYFEKARKINDIKSFILVSAYINIFFTSKGNPKSWGLDNLRDVRNLEEHRCAVALKPENWRELERQYNKLALPARRKLAIQNKIPFTLSRSDRELENEYYTLKFVRERNFDAVLEELKNLYNNVAK
jgi:hypothetical protein